MWYCQSKGGTFLNIKVTPQSKRREIVGIFGDFLKVRIQTSPTKGKANKELIKLLAKELDIPQSSIKIVKGLKNSLKTIFVPIAAKTLKQLLKYGSCLEDFSF
ncbi:MAG: hypothetical protein COT24_03295 [Candidatus Kerfeldbacteria bacterium CG08_land_8_20_14_0_20_40_16]|uniref:UPF0235 protein COT24_03295 n=1 Tax=Candidatus Kerfeldbacteria bacterium CG08_land_8_20_14_0_20_40_16 TaxID=2014244 RepID=A0A2H0YVG8_9BACT|nr:MAG: hypothetical protein COT24_03295 [Candidatus Kerfeldbacteria bacterium CG08_land_8_20_14_0_20_40_16]